MNFFNYDSLSWYNTQVLKNKSFICGYCGDKVSSNQGYGILNSSQGRKSGEYGGSYICSNCNGLTFFTPRGEQLPGELFGNNVDNVPDDLSELYNEARECFSVNSYTAVIMLCRKMLMNVAVSQGASENMKFIQYVNYLSEKNYIPPNGKIWVDHIRKKGNEANHEIKSMSQEDAKNLLVFIEMILKFVYEFPNMIIE